MKKDNEKLLDCPFCGSEAELKEYPSTGTWFGVECKGCYGTAGIHKAGGAQGAIKAWNTRSKPLPDVEHKCAGRTNGYGGFTCTECGDYHPSVTESARFNKQNNKVEKLVDILEKAVPDFEGKIHNEPFAKRVLKDLGCFDCENEKCYMNCSPAATPQPSSPLPDNKEVGEILQELVQIIEGCREDNDFSSIDSFTCQPAREILSRELSKELSQPPATGDDVVERVDKAIDECHVRLYGNSLPCSRQLAIAAITTLQNPNPNGDK